MKFATVRNEITKRIENGETLTKIGDYIDTLFIKKKINNDVYDRALTLLINISIEQRNAIIYG